MPNDHDPEPGQESEKPEATTAAEPAASGLAQQEEAARTTSEEPGAEDTARETPVGPELTGAAVRAALRAQWRDQRPDPLTVRHVLTRTIGEDPRGFLIEHVRPRIDDPERLWSRWDEAQLASDATRVGRLLRPLVGLLPLAHRWYAVWIAGPRFQLISPGRRSPVRVLRDAEVLCRGQVVDEGIAREAPEDETSRSF